MEKASKLRILGVMSGTSLDGLDLALCEFQGSDAGFSYSILKSKTLSYPEAWKQRLASLMTASAEEYLHAHHEYGKFIGENVLRFTDDINHKPDYISSHGHTIFHQPSRGFTSQLGCGATISAVSGISTVCDFRSLDVANGGQGAPLVPIGDELLFSQYSSCLNIGGIANISFREKNTRQAFDICFANMVLNYLSEKKGQPYDDKGLFAASGKTEEKLLEKFKTLLDSSSKSSLGREGFEKHIMPLLEESRVSTEDKLATFTEYIALQISETLNSNRLKNVLVTGGGAYNTHLINLIRNKFKGEVVIPDDQTVQFKEALIFAFLGYLRINNQINTLKSVTGAKSDSIGGAVYVSI